MGARADESAAAGAVRGDAPEIVYVIDGSADWTVLEVSTREAMSRHRKSEDPLQSRTACLSTVDRRLTTDDRCHSGSALLSGSGSQKLAVNPTT